MSSVGPVEGRVRHRWVGLVQTAIWGIAGFASVGFGASVVDVKLVAAFHWGYSFECRCAEMVKRGEERVRVWDSCVVHRNSQRIFRFDPAARFEWGSEVHSAQAPSGHVGFCARLYEDSGRGPSVRLEFAGSKLVRLDTIPAAQREERCSAKPAGE